jgi:hypothetical protein
MFLGLAILALVIAVAFMYYRQKEKFQNGVVVGSFAQPIPDNPTQTYTQQPLNLSFVFADPVPDTATSFDRVLSRFTDKKAPTALVQGAGFPEAAPYADSEVEAVARFLRDQGQPQYLEEVTAGGDDEDGEGDFGGGEGGSGDDLYDRAVAVVTRDGKASTSYVQRRLQIGYNRAASLIERMEREGVVSPANHAGKREILAPPPP